MRHKKDLTLSLMALALMGATIWWMSSNVVWLGDDLDYKFKMKGEIWQSWGFINTLTDFIESQTIHYKYVNGRVVAHSLVQLFNGILGQQVFAICNAIAYMLFALSLAKSGGADARSNPGGVVTAVCLSVLCFVTKMMPTCQIGYIWGMWVNLIWIMTFFTDRKPSPSRTCCMVLAGIIAGNWQEAISIGVCAGLGIWWIYQFFSREGFKYFGFDWRRSWMMLGYFIGTFSNILCPANFGRVSSISTPLLHQMMIISYSLPAVILLLIALVIRCYGKKYKRTHLPKKDVGIPPLFLWAGLLTLLAFNAIIGVYSNRQLFGANLFACVLLLMTLPRHRFGKILNAIAAMFVLALWWMMYQGITEVRHQYDDIISLHDQSDDGSVEYDRTRVMPLGFPLNAKYYEDILGQFNNDLHHSLMKDFKHIRKGKTLKLKPTTRPDREKVEMYAPGHFHVTVRMPKGGDEKREVIVYGHYSIAGIINVPAEPKTLEIITYSRRRPPFGTATIIPEYPFFRADSLTLKE